MGTTKRGSRLRVLFVTIFAAFSIILGLSYFNFVEFSTFSSYVLPGIVEMSCTGSSEASRPILDLESWSPRATNETCRQNCTCSEVTCSPPYEKIVVQEKIVEKFVNQWWARRKPWHNPSMFPLCSMDACFNFTRCSNMDELLVYHYDVPAPPVRYFQGLNSTPWYTADPDNACLFFVFQDVEDLWPNITQPNSLKYWNHGLNHVMITFVDLWHQRNPPEDTIENASVLSSALYETTYRPGFDISVPLPGRQHVRHLQSLKPLERKYLLTFKGIRYLSPTNYSEGAFRSNPSFRNIHNGKDVIIVTSCRHGSNDEKRKKNPKLGEGCDEDQKLYDQYEFVDLMNATFSLAPAGRSGSSYRFIEVLSGGAIPVLIVDNHVKPFENIIQWPRCALQFPTSEMHRIVPALRQMAEKEIEERQTYCLWVYDEFLKDDATLLRSVMRSLKARFFGMFSNFSEMSSIYAGNNRRRLPAIFATAPARAPRES